MMMSSTLENGTYLCKPCNRVFQTWESLLQHKAFKNQIDGKEHIHCKVCGQDFETHVAQRRHVQQIHPKEQVLDCPGCGHGPFLRLASLMEHIEHGNCPRIDSTTLDEAREKKLEFTKKLAKLTNEPVKNDYSSFVSQKPVDGTCTNMWTNSQESDFEMMGSKFVALGVGQDATNTSPTSQVDQGNRPGSPRARKGKENLFPYAAPVQLPNTPQLEAVSPPSEKTLYQAINPDDPDNPSFNARKYYSDIVEQYICPKLGCGKVFKSSGRLVGHLRSPAHGGKTYRCPYCFGVFKSLTAITAHVESSSVNCRIRETDGYGAYLDQLTAGIANVDKHKEDGSAWYTITDSARASFFGQKKAPDEEEKPQAAGFW